MCHTSIKKVCILDLRRKIFLKAETILRAIEHTNLKATTTAAEIEQLCKEAIEYSFLGVCVNPVHVPLAKKILRGTPQKLVTVVGFPLGASLPEIKAAEAAKAVEQGADEIDMVINIGAIKDGNWELVERDIEAVVKASKVPVKVILENCYLTEAEKVRACQASEAAGAKFVKTSTGFGTGGATIEDVELMRRNVHTKIGVKASGGVKTLEDVIEFLNSGANRIGTSSGVSIADELARNF